MPAFHFYKKHKNLNQGLLILRFLCLFVAKIPSPVAEVSSPYKWSFLFPNTPHIITARTLNLKPAEIDGPQEHK